MVNCVFLIAKSPSDAPQLRSDPKGAIRCYREVPLGFPGQWWAVLGIKKSNPFLVASMGACQKNRHSGHPTPFDRVDVARRWWTAQAMQMSCGPAELPLLMLGREKRWSEAYYNLGVSYAEMHKYDKAQMRPSTRDNQAQVTRIFRQTSIHAGWIWVNSWRFIVQKRCCLGIFRVSEASKNWCETPNIKRLALLEKALLQGPHQLPTHRALRSSMCRGACIHSQGNGKRWI